MANDVFYLLYPRIRRTQSGTLQREDLEPGEFKRGGLRATAGPCLARAGETLTSVRYGTDTIIKYIKYSVLS